MNLISLVFLSASLGLAQYQTYSKTYEFNTFEEASKAPSFIRFDMESTLLGFLTARFPGYAKRFMLSWEKNQSEGRVKNLHLEVPVRFMDTDKSSRTEEMQEDSFEMVKYPVILVSIDGQFELQEFQKITLAHLTIRGKKIEKEIPLNVKRSEDSWVVSGDFYLSISESNIISPTIARGIASFDDRVHISYKFIVED